MARGRCFDIRGRNPIGDQSVYMHFLQYTPVVSPQVPKDREILKLTAYNSRSIKLKPFHSQNTSVTNDIRNSNGRKSVKGVADTCVMCRQQHMEVQLDVT
ncbi:hypothetical protein RR46_08892 [Papilio xuthus]|uniref:Uncharacterized protein n=1 Tax=Papilio xuthus TaxID=66420 RepID=A0A194PR48_PAPXU|nr:hypothetical protein RR46_08892 [Papilio xuthus]